MRKAIFFIFVAMVASAVLAVTPFTKPLKKTAGSARAASAAAVKSATHDTIFNPPADSVGVAGFEKTLRSTHESMYVSNATDSDILGLSIDITYFDTYGRMLHKTSHELNSAIPSHETRLIDVKSFDNQGLYYYYLSPEPKRASKATPFKVSVNVNYILIPKPSNK